MNDSDTMLDRVRKLLAKAEDPSCSPAEAEALTAKASELIAKYGIDRALLATTDGPEIPGDRIIVVDAPYALDKSTLLSRVAEALRCRAVLRTRYPPPHYRKQRSVHLFGFDSDLERAELLYTSLLVQAANALGQTPVPEWDTPAAFRRSWLAGFTNAIVFRLHEAERRAEQRADQERHGDTSSGTSVVVVLADRSVKVDQRVAEAYAKLREMPPRRLSGRGFTSGYAAGRRADIGATRVRRSSRRALDGPR